MLKKTVHPTDFSQVFDEALLLLVDGANIIQYYWKNNKKYVRIQRLKQICKYLNGLRHKFPKMQFGIIVDNSLKNRIVGDNWLNTQILECKIVETLPFIEADAYIIKLYLQNRTKIWVISNDRFRDYKKRNPQIHNMPVFSCFGKGRDIEIPFLQQRLKERFYSNHQCPILPIKLPRYLEGIF
jgi:hypothetical protein